MATFLLCCEFKSEFFIKKLSMTLNIKIDDFMIESKECIFEIFVQVSIDSEDINQFAHKN